MGQPPLSLPVPLGSLVEIPLGHPCVPSEAHQQVNRVAMPGLIRALVGFVASRTVHFQFIQYFKHTIKFKK